jgi:Zn-dependent M28 family amino/carboxypeptidase
LPQELRTTVVKLATEIGERNCYRTNGLEAAAAWIEQQFGLAGLKLRRLPVAVPAGPPYDCGAMTVWNLEAEKPGTKRASEVIVVGAHYDTKVATRSWTGRGPPLVDERGTSGADDNASGVAALLAIARALANVSTERTIRFVAFVNEERPFYQTDAMGSVVYARRCRAVTNEFVVGMISLETLGCYSAQPHHKRFWFSFASLIGLPAKPDYVAFLSDRYSWRFVRECADVYRVHSPVPVRTLLLPSMGKLVAWSDDWSFWREGIPAFSVTDTAFLRHDHYHEISDTEEKLNYAPMADVVWGLRHVIERLANSAEIWRPSIRAANNQ